MELSELKIQFPSEFIKSPISKEKFGLTCYILLNLLDLTLFCSMELMLLDLRTLLVVVKKSWYLYKKKVMFIHVKPLLNLSVVNMDVPMHLTVKWKMPLTLCGYLMEKVLLHGLKSDSNNLFKLLVLVTRIELLPVKEQKKLKFNIVMEVLENIQSETLIVKLNLKLIPLPLNHLDSL